MDLVVISSARNEINETTEVVKMFESGLENFHIRKPKMSRGLLSDYIKRFPEEYRNRLVLHSYHGLAHQYKLGGIHLSRSHRKRGKMYHFGVWTRKRFNPDLIITRTFHKLTDVTSDKRAYSYAFLSPVFDSISQSSLSAGFSRRALLILTPQANQPIYALGGISIDKLESVAENGFHGAALHGCLWESDEPAHEVYIRARATADRIRDLKT